MTDLEGHVRHQIFDRVAFSVQTYKAISEGMGNLQENIAIIHSCGILFLLMLKKFLDGTYKLPRKQRYSRDRLEELRQQADFDWRDRKGFEEFRKYMVVKWGLSDTLPLI